MSLCVHAIKIDTRGAAATLILRTPASAHFVSPSNLMLVVCVRCTGRRIPSVALILLAVNEDALVYVQPCASLCKYNKTSELLRVLCLLLHLELCTAACKSASGQAYDTLVAPFMLASQKIVSVICFYVRVNQSITCGSCQTLAGIGLMHPLPCVHVSCAQPHRASASVHAVTVCVYGKVSYFVLTWLFRAASRSHVYVADLRSATLNETCSLLTKHDGICPHLS